MESEAGQSLLRDDQVKLPKPAAAVPAPDSAAEKKVTVKKEPAAEEVDARDHKETNGGGGGVAHQKLGSCNDVASALPNTTDSRATAEAKSGADVSVPGPEQLTIFYGGNVVVFDGIPAEKAREIMAIAAAAARAVKSADIKKIEWGPAPAAAPVLSRSPSMQSTSCALASQQYAAHKNSVCKMQADLPIARRHSLQRFFEKRRDRMMSKSPYSIPSSPSAAENMKLDSDKLLSGDHRQQTLAASDPQPCLID